MARINGAEFRKRLEVYGYTPADWSSYYIKCLEAFSIDMTAFGIVPVGLEIEPGDVAIHFSMSALTTASSINHSPIQTVAWPTLRDFRVRSCKHNLVTHDGNCAVCACYPKWEERMTFAKC